MNNQTNEQRIEQIKEHCEFLGRSEIIALKEHLELIEKEMIELNIQ